MKLKNLLLKNHWAKFNQTWHKASIPLVTGTQICSNEGSRPVSRRDNNEIAKIHWQNFKNVFSKTNGAISTKRSRNRPWVMGIQFCSNEGSCPFLRGDNNKNAENISTNFSRSIESISTKHGTKHAWVKRS